jgi:Mycoplasma protein of unknown function, DUF285
MKQKKHKDTFVNKQKVTEQELREIVKTCASDADLNYLDVSGIYNMSGLFLDSKFNGNISCWDVSGARNMRLMFALSDFNGDISKWDVSNVKDMSFMFGASRFHGDISKWNVSKVKDMSRMFNGSKLNGDISKWKFHNDVDQSDESLAYLIDIGKQYEDNRRLKLIGGVNEKTKTPKYSI